MRILVNFMSRAGINIHCIEEDARTPISGRVDVPDDKTLIKMLRYVGAHDAAIGEVETDLRRLASGSVFLTLETGRKNLPRISPVQAKQIGLW